MTNLFLYPFSTATAHNLVFNINDIDDTVNFEIPHDLSFISDLVSIGEMVDNEVTPIPITQTTGAYRELKYPWIEVPKSLLNLSIGMHLYQVKMQNTVTDAYEYLYSIYTVQQIPETKDYIYMKRTTT